MDLLTDQQAVTIGRRLDARDKGCSYHHRRHSSHSIGSIDNPATKARSQKRVPGS